MSEVNKVYEDFWKPIVAPSGDLDLDQVKKELYDYRNYMRETAKVYDHITNGQISKVNTTAEAVIAVSDDCVTELVAAELTAANSRIQELRDRLGEDNLPIPNPMMPKEWQEGYTAARDYVIGQMRAALSKDAEGTPS